MAEREMTEREIRALTLFGEGYNCAQAVFASFCDLTGMDKEAALRISSSFGGGIARQREVCGTVSSAALVLGIVWGYNRPDREEQRAHYARVSAFCNRFRTENGTLVCRDLLRLTAERAARDTRDPTPTERTPEFYSSRPCVRLVDSAVRILEELLAELEETGGVPRTDPL